MARLIDADETLRSLSDDLPYKDSVRRVLIQAPTVDAVQVTRCKGCRWFKMYKCRMGYSKYEDFCSYGRPKEERHAEPED